MAGHSRRTIPAPSDCLPEYCGLPFQMQHGVGEYCGGHPAAWALPRRRDGEQSNVPPDYRRQLRRRCRLQVSAVRQKPALAFSALPDLPRRFYRTTVSSNTRRAEPLLPGKLGAVAKGIAVAPGQGLMPASIYPAAGDGGFVAANFAGNGKWRAAQNCRDFAANGRA